MGRDHVDFVNAEEVPAEAVLDGAFAGTTRRLLSRDERSGAETAIVLIPAGWSGDLRVLDGPLELIALDGDVQLGGRTVPRDGWARAPQPRALGTLSSASDVAVLAMTDPTGPADGTLAIVDVAVEPWSVAARGGPEGITVKRLHDGATVSFMAHQRAGYRTGPEFHECPEELYVLGGDVTGRFGTMTRGSYFWRPEYVTHGPYSSEHGLTCFVRGHGDIVAHWIDDADATVEDNRAYAAALSR
jgi:hypothetical protein